MATILPDGSLRGNRGMTGADFDDPPGRSNRIMLYSSSASPGP